MKLKNEYRTRPPARRAYPPACRPYGLEAASERMPNFEVSMNTQELAEL
jgi:hypothetical protein